MRRSILALTLLLMASCRTPTPTPAHVTDATFPTVQGENLNRESITLPGHYLGKPTLYLVGYVQRAQFDIDRWILGVLQAEVPVQIVEVPTIAGMMPEMVQSFINNGMRSGIPSSDWGSVVTVYGDADKIIAAIGNDRPQSAYAVLVDKDGRIVWTSNIGYSAAQILDLKQAVNRLD